MPAYAKAANKQKSVYVYALKQCKTGDRLFLFDRWDDCTLLTAPLSRTVKSLCKNKSLKMAEPLSILEVGFEVGKLIHFLGGKAIQFLPEDKPWLYRLKKWAKKDTEKTYELLKGSADEKVHELSRAIMEVYKDIQEMVPSGESFSTREFENHIREIACPTKWSRVQEHFEDLRKLAINIFGKTGVNPLHRLVAIEAELICNSVLRRDKNSSIMIGLQECVSDIFRCEDLMKHTFYGLSCFKKNAANDVFSQSQQTAKDFFDFRVEPPKDFNKKCEQTARRVGRVLSAIERMAVYAFIPELEQQFSDLMRTLRSPPVNHLDFLKSKLTSTSYEKIPKIFSQLHHSAIKEVSGIYFLEFPGFRKCAALSNSMVLLANGNELYARDLLPKEETKKYLEEAEAPGSKKKEDAGDSFTYAAAISFHQKCTFGTLWDNVEMRDLVLVHVNGSDHIRVFTISGSFFHQVDNIMLEKNWSKTDLEMLVVRPNLILVKPSFVPQNPDETQTNVFVHEVSDHQDSAETIWREMNIKVASGSRLVAANFCDRKKELDLVTSKKVSVGVKGGFVDFTEISQHILPQMARPGEQQKLSICPSQTNPTHYALPFHASRALAIFPGFGLTSAQYRNNEERDLEFWKLNPAASTDGRQVRDITSPGEGR